MVIEKGRTHSEPGKIRIISRIKNLLIVAYSCNTMYQLYDKDLHVYLLTQEHIFS